MTQVRKRKGRSGGLEFSIELLPDEARAELIRREANPGEPVNVITLRENDPLTGIERDRRDARLHVLAAFDEFLAANHLTVRAGYAAILVDFAEVERRLERPEAKGLSIELFAKTAGLRHCTAMRLVRDGHVPTTEGMNPKTKAKQRFLSPADIDAFHRRFVTLRHLAVLLGLSWQSLRTILKDASVAPFAPDGEDIGAIFEWEVIEKLFCCRWPTPIRRVP